MKAAYTGWTWLTAKDAETAKNQLEQSFKECKFLGYDYVENFAFIGDYFEDPNELIEMEKRCGVELVNLYGHFGTDVEENIKVGKKQIDFLAAIGGKWYNCQHGGYFGDGGPLERPTNPEVLDKICAIADTLGAYAKEKGVTLCFHPHYGTCVFWESDIDYLMAHTDPRYVYLCFDTGHFTFSKEDAVKAAKEFGPRIGHVHLKDIRPDMMEKAYAEGFMFRKAVLEGCFTIPGDGCVDYPGVFKALHDAHYEGWFIVEAEQDPAKANPLEYAKMAREYIKKTAGI